MLKILRSFLIGASLFFLVAAMLIVFLVNHETEQQFVSSNLPSNRTLTSSIANAATPLLPSLFKKIKEFSDSPSTVLTTDVAKALNQTIHQSHTQLPIDEVIIRSIDGRVVYSTQAYLMNKKRVDDGFSAAILGKTISEHAPVKRFDSQQGHYKHDFFVTHSPILNNNETQGVITVKTDHYQHRQALSQTKWLSIALTLGGLFGFYLLMLACLYWVRRQHLRDYQERDLLEQRLRHNSDHDQLTGLPNRTKFIERINTLAGICARVPHDNFAVLLMDLDSFKVVNESLGHEAGNDLLRKVAKRIRRKLKPEDFLARLGGDEFGIVVEDAKDVQRVIGLAKSIHSQFKKNFHLKGRDVTETISIGITICQGKKLSAEDIVRDADIAMYRAKNKGRGQFELFNKHMHVEAMERIELESDMRRGVAEGEFFNRYHPIVDLQTGITHSLEALVRWAHPLRHEVQPNDFISIAEEIDLIDQIDDSVMKSATRELAMWRNELPQVEDLSINVNYSACNFHGRFSVNNIFENLARSGVNGQNLKIELTESSILRNESVAFNIFEELRHKGIHLCMDDFGTGFSSLSYLRKLKFDMLKIDMSFIQDMVHDEDARKIVRTIIEMGDNLGMAVTAEGVETQEQVDLLKQMGCRYAQGFYFSKPMRAKEVVPFISQQIENCQLQLAADKSELQPA